MELWIYIFAGVLLAGMGMGGVIGHAIGYASAISELTADLDPDYETRPAHEESL